MYSFQPPGSGEEVSQQILLRRLDGPRALCPAGGLRLHLVTIQAFQGVFRPENLVILGEHFRVQDVGPVNALAVLNGS